MSAYGKALKQLIDFSGVKMYVIAEKVGYDVSYISKWCNKGYLPSAKMSQKINRTLAELLAEDIRQHRDLNEFCDLFEVKASAEDLESTILQILQESYGKSDNKETERKEEKEKQSSARVLTHSNDIYQYFYNELPKSLYGLNEQNGPVEILCSLDLCRYLAASLPELPHVKLSDIRIKLAVRRERLHEERMKLLPRLHALLSKYNYMSFEICTDERLSGANIILVRDRLAAFCSSDDHDRIITVFHTNDLKTVRQIYSKMLPLFSASHIMLHASDPIEFHQNGYRTDFYSRNHFQILLAYGFEFLLPKDCWQSVVKTAKEKYKDDNIALLVSRLQITWEEIFERGSIDFFLLKTSVFKYIESGEIIFTDVVHSMTPQQRKSHIQNILETTRKNPNINFYLIDDEKLPNKLQSPYMSVFSNRKKAFIKSPARYKNSAGPFFYSILDDGLINDMTDFFDNIRTSPWCTKYDHQALAAFYEKYHTLINRMIDLQEH